MTHLCEHCGKTFGRKANLTKHFNIYHKNRCTICNYKCECVDIHMGHCVKYNDKLQNILNAFDNQNEVTEILRRKFNNSEYIDVYKVAYALFAYDTVFPNSYFMPSDLLSDYLGYDSHYSLLKLINRILIENEDYIKYRQEYIRLLPNYFIILNKTRKQKIPVYLNYVAIIKIFYNSTLDKSDKHFNIIVFCYKHDTPNIYQHQNETIDNILLEYNKSIRCIHGNTTLCTDCGNYAICIHKKPIKGCSECNLKITCRSRLEPYNTECRIRRNKYYDNFCTHCFINLFPNDPRCQNIRFKSKENKVIVHITSIFSGFVHDKPFYADLENGCCATKRRIDLRKLINNTMLCIEVDEYQHKRYIQYDEFARYNDLFMDFSGKYIFIRYNPDPFLDINGILIDLDFNNRMTKLVNVIGKHILRILNDDNNELIEIYHLYYDNIKNEKRN